MAVLAISVSLAANASAAIVPGENYTRDVPGWTGRPYIVHVPSGYAGRSLPVVMLFHGGGATAQGMQRVTCKNGTSYPNPTCMDGIADRETFITVYPSGTGNDTTGRVWNAGGGSNGFTCIEAGACPSVDDVSYVTAALTDLASFVDVDTTRVYATGISNGAALAHRLACQLSNRIAAIAPVAAGNQFATSATCSPARAVPVIEFHGTLDPVWPYDGGAGTNPCCTTGNRIAIPKPTVNDWATRDKCAGYTDTSLPDIAADNTTVTERVYNGCAAAVVFYMVNNGGHTWPGGTQYDTTGNIGYTTFDISANELMWSFFKPFSVPLITGIKHLKSR